jgi:hypothetical protein
MKLKHGVANALLAVGSIGVTLLVLEIGLRLYHGELFDFSSELPAAPNRILQPRAAYDSLLGWVPTGGLDTGNGTSHTRDQLRSNGPGAPGEGPTVLTVGDSFTYGEEVADSLTWPARLARVHGARVLNAGVFAYGVDQAFLRAARLLEVHRPAWVVLAFVRDDVNRTEFSYYSAWKPYYAMEGGEPVLRNVPVPETPPPTPRLNGLRSAFGYSLLAGAIARRVLPEWWYYGAILREHEDGVEITARLMARLDELVRVNGARLLVVGLGTGGPIGTNEGMAEVLGRIADEGVSTLDLVPDIEARTAQEGDGLFMPEGHYGPELNAWVAARVWDFIGAPDNGPAR